MSLLMIEKEHNGEDFTMGEQKKSAHFMDIMGQVIHILIYFLKLFSSKVNCLYYVVETWFYSLSFSNFFPFPLKGQKKGGGT